MESCSCARTFNGDDSAGRVPPTGGGEFRGGWVWLRRGFENQGSHSRTVLSKMGLPFLKIEQDVIFVLYYIIALLI